MRSAGVACAEDLRRLIANGAGLSNCTHAVARGALGVAEGVGFGKQGDTVCSQVLEAGLPPSRPTPLPPKTAKVYCAPGDKAGWGVQVIVRPLPMRSSSLVIEVNGYWRASDCVAQPASQSGGRRVGSSAQTVKGPSSGDSTVTLKAVFAQAVRGETAS